MNAQEEKLQQDALEVIEKRMPFINKNKQLTISVDSNASQLTVDGLNDEEEIILKEILQKEYGYTDLK